MDAEGLRALLERKRGRPCNAMELHILKHLTVRDCVRIWDDVAFTDADFDLTKYVPWSVEEKELTPQRKQILRDIRRLRDALARLGTPDPKDGYIKASFKTLLTDNKLKGLVDSVPGACRLARKEGLVFFASRDLVLGQHDDVKIFFIPVDPDPTDCVVSSVPSSPAVSVGGSLVSPGTTQSEGTVRSRKGSIDMKAKPKAVTEDEISAVIEALDRLAVLKVGKRKAKFGALCSDEALSSLGTERLSAICSEAKAKGKLHYPIDQLSAGNDDNVYVELLGGSRQNSSVIERDSSTA